MMNTYTGKVVNPLDFTTKDVDIRDIAHALAQCNRFAGHSKFPVSVAQHSVYVSRVACKLAREKGAGLTKSARVALAGLLHDASEAYLGDVTHWVKKTPAFEAYRVVEHEVQQTVFTKFKLLEELPSEVSLADQIMVCFEASKGFDSRFYFGGDPRYTTKIPKYWKDLVGNWRPWSWKTAEEVFLSQARLLGVKC